MSSLPRKNLLLLRGHFFFSAFAGWSLAPFTVQIFDTALGIPVFAFTGIVIIKLILDGITRPIISTFIDRNPGQHMIVMQLLVFAEITSWAILLLPDPPLDPKSPPYSLTLECAGTRCHYLRVDEGVVGADFQERLLAISRDRRFNCDGHCDNGASLVTSFSPKSIQSGVGIDVKCQLHCDDDKLSQEFGDDSSGGFNLFGENHRFFLLILAVHILLVSTSPGLISYSNTLTIRILEDVPGENFGAQRVYSSFGAVVSGVLVGLWRFYGGPHKLHGVAEFSPMIVAFVIGSCLNIIVLSRIKLSGEKSQFEHKRDDKNVSVSVEESASDRTKKILNALSTRRGANILILNTICGILFGSFMATYRILDEVDDSGGSDMKLVQGLSVAFSTLAEIPAMRVSGGLMSKFGADNIMVAAAMSLSVKATFFGMMSSLWAAVPMEAFAGFVFSLYYPSSAMIFDEMAPEGTKNTLQGFGQFNFGLAVGIGLTLSGALSTTYTAQTTFFSMGISGITTLLILRMLPRRSRKRHRFQRRQSFLSLLRPAESGGRRMSTPFVHVPPEYRF